MLKYIVLLTSFFVFFSCGSSKNNSTIPENAPEWVSKTHSRKYKRFVRKINMDAKNKYI
jgi:hypothetical protein